MFFRGFRFKLFILKGISPSKLPLRFPSIVPDFLTIPLLLIRHYSGTHIFFTLLTTSVIFCRTLYNMYLYLLMCMISSKVFGCFSTVFRNTFDLWLFFVILELKCIFTIIVILYYVCLGNFHFIRFDDNKYYKNIKI